MLLVLGLSIISTGLPVWALLCAVASAFAALGVASGQFDLNILSALPTRLVGLLEHDLLQALPLYVFVGVLLQRLSLADALFSTLARLFRPLGAGHSLAALSVGALIAPMNGSVASSSALLSRLVAPRLEGADPARATALISVAATIGVVVPPSLVLILLGTAMLGAHTEASNLPGFSLGTQRIINTQDVFHAALLPAAAVLLLWSLIAWWQGRQSNQPTALATPRRSEVALALLAVGAIVLLLAGVFTGKFYAVEAAATGGVLLIIATVATRALDKTQWSEVLRNTLSLSGALFALLVGATSFSLVFRLFGTDQWLAALVLGSTLAPQVTAALVLLLVGLCAWVLDAFEMIFVIIPVVAPLLIVQLGDAQQVAVLLLLVLQLSFLIPPMGYAVLMARSRSGLAQVATYRIVKALLPFILAQLVLTVIVFALPRVVHLLDEPVAASANEAPASEQDIERQTDEMAR
jgi:TRAP-type mannitol/chloroaromatic compound transport system permease large subunit